MRVEKKLNYKKIKPFMAVMFALSALWALLFIGLMLWGLFASFKTVDGFRSDVLGFPKEWAFGNYSSVFKYFHVEIFDKTALSQRSVGMAELAINSLLYVFGCAFAGTATPFLMAYLNVKFRYKFSKIVYAVVIVTMVLPIVGAGPSELRVLRLLGLYDTWGGIWIQRANFLGFYFLLLYAAFRGVPKELSEAAYVDGASELRTMLQIVMPLARNAFLVVFILSGIRFWNEFQPVLIYLPTHPTMATALFNLSRSSINELNNVPMQVAGCYMFMAPVLILLIVFHKKIMGNVQVGGLKE